MNKKANKTAIPPSKKIWTSSCLEPFISSLMISQAVGSRLQMAIRCSSFKIAIPWKAKNSSTTSRSSMLCNSHAQLQVASKPGKKFSLSNKVFEDTENGILCYMDEKGDIVCEGYDEGPRLAGRPLQGFKRQKQTIDKRHKTMATEERLKKVEENVGLHQSHDSSSV